MIRFVIENTINGPEDPPSKSPTVERAPEMEHCAQSLRDSYGVYVYVSQRKRWSAWWTPWILDTKLRGLRTDLLGIKLNSTYAI